MRLEPLKRPSRDAASPSTGGAEFSPHTLGLGGEPSRYGPGADTRRGRPHQQHERLPSSACPLKRLTRCSRDERLEGSRPAFAWGDLARGLNPSPSDYGTAFASSLVPYPPPHRRPPYGGPTPRGGRRAYHVLRTDHGWCRLCLFADGSTATAGEEGNPCTWPRTFLVQACQHLWLAGSHDVYRQFT